MRTILLRITAIVLSTAPLLLVAAPTHAPASQAREAGVADQRCFEAKVGKRKTSLGIHQWTVRQFTRWCAEHDGTRWRIVSIGRRAIFRTGTNWRLVSRSGLVRERDRSASAASWFHFRLRYPHFEQNCYPRLALKVWPSGRYERDVYIGCS